ncbi:hypothetical protein K438DRAFT_1954594 [Mycena galopus ATCC 62051]|nr:hypothetical protein K438DRAFT_1954594 [Mycena galopus ATCC 62051]
MATEPKFAPSNFTNFDWHGCYHEYECNAVDHPTTICQVREAIRAPSAMKRNRQPTPKKPIPETVAERTLWQSYRALPANTRLKFSVGMAIFAAAGITVSNYLEKKIPVLEQSE